jgi:hypothetical protein
MNVSVFAGKELQDAVDSAVTFDVEHGTIDGRPLGHEQRDVVLAPRHRWIVPSGAN